MLNGISWPNYFIAVAALLATYYIVIALLFYRQELMQWVHKKKGSIPPHTEAKPLSPIDEVEKKVKEIHGILEQAGKGPDRPTLTGQLKGSLANFGGLRQAAFRVAIKNYIHNQSKELCGVTFSEEELHLITAPPDG